MNCCDYRLSFLIKKESKNRKKKYSISREGETKKKFNKKKKILMLTWEDLNSSNSKSNEEAYIGLMVDIFETAMSK